MKLIDKNLIFVFGSNLSGYHGAGAARYARLHKGAVMGVGEGMTGHSYALPTKGLNISYMPLDEVAIHVSKFLEYAAKHPGDQFQVTCVGCGLAGFTHGQIAPMFVPASQNCQFDTNWRPILSDKKIYWGTFG